MLTLFRKTATSAAFAMAVLAPAPVFADHWHGHFGFYFGVPLYAPYHYYYAQPWFPPYPAPYYAYPPAPYAPPVYAEAGAAQQAEPASWYYCPDSNAYYPYVAHCPSPWQRVPTQPPATAR